MIKAITFDFWDTIVIDDSDEPKRAAKGLPGKAEARLQALTAEIREHHPQIAPEKIKGAFAHANAVFRHHWQEEHFTPGVASRLQEAYTFLGIDRTPGFGHVVREIEEMEVKIAPDFAPGIHSVVAELAKDYRLGIISDAIHTPGRGLRQILDREGLLQYFTHWIFSDEVGVSKPDPSAFEKAATGLNVPFNQIVHIGDREKNDIAGPLAMGMSAILYIGVTDRGSSHTQATAICRDYGELPSLIKRLQG